MKLSHEENKKIAEHPIDDVRAYDYCLRARHEIYQYTEESLERALQFLNKGLEIVGENILIFEGLGHVHYQFWNMGLRIEEKYLTKAKDYGMKILAIEHDSPYGHFLLGLLQMTGGTLIKSLYHFKKVLDKKPDHADALAWTSAISAFFGKTDIVEKAISRLSKIDPFHPFIYVMPGILQLYLGQFESALEKLTQEYQSRKDDPLYNWCYSLSLLYSCHFDEAFTVINRLPKDPLVNKILILLYYANQKKKSEVLQLISTKLKLWAEKDFSLSLYLAECYSLINEEEEALNWLEKAVNRGFINYPFLNEYDPFLENIRGEERFKKLMERVEYEWENFEV